MSATRVGFFTGLLFLTGLYPFTGISHQGEYAQKALFASLSRSTSHVGRLLYPQRTVTPRPRSSGAVGHPVVRITHAALVRWTKVAICEEGGWNNAHGPTYFGSIGWLDATWQMFRASWMPTRMDKATVNEQVWAAQRFAGYYHLVPDQHGCTGGY